ncbi:hypothetical protein HK405_012449 [Cladochytrium tenue]|nr:hypothetical protein HK405_012449 [Cladochytrium tenue]
MTRSPTGVPPHELKSLRENFGLKLVDKEHYVSAMLNKLQGYLGEWDAKAGGYYWPGTALIQSSGTGKSRLVRELTAHGIFVVYCSFLQWESSGFPRRSPEIADYLAKTNAGDDFFAYYIACAELVEDAYRRKESPREFYERQIDLKNGLRFWRLVMNRVRDISLKGGRVSADVLVSRRGLDILFVFDEARDLLPKHDAASKQGLWQPASDSAFAWMRRDARRFPRPSRAFVLTIDTTSRVSDLAPVSYVDPSKRIKFGTAVFNPLYLIASMDAKAEPLYNTQLEQAFVPKTQFLHGRPLWWSLLSIEPQDVWKIVLTACEKLVGGLNFDKKFPMNEAHAATIIRTRVPFVVHRADLAGELVASHMWWCLYISPDRNQIVSTMGSEPILSEAGAIWMKKRGEDVLKLFTGMVQRSMVDIGHGGEAVPGTINHYYTGVLDLKDFIGATFNVRFLRMLAAESRKLSEITRQPDPIAVGKVSFTHFVAASRRMPSMPELALLFSRGAAIMCPPGTPGVDLLIPVILPNESGKYVINGDNMTVVLISVKNNKSRAKINGYRRCATEFNSAYRCGLDLLPRHIYLSLYVGFRPNSPKPDVEILEPVDGRRLEELASKLRSDALDSIANLSEKSKRDAAQRARLFRQVSGSVLGLDHCVYECMTEHEYKKVDDLTTELPAKSRTGTSEPNEARAEIEGMPLDVALPEIPRSEPMDALGETDETPEEMEGTLSDDDGMEVDFPDASGSAPGGSTDNLLPASSGSLLDYLRLLLRPPRTPVDMAKDKVEHALLQRMTVPSDLDKLADDLRDQLKPRPVPLP